MTILKSWWGQCLWKAGLVSSLALCSRCHVSLRLHKALLQINCKRNYGCTRKQILHEATLERLQRVETSSFNAQKTCRVTSHRAVIFTNYIWCFVFKDDKVLTDVGFGLFMAFGHSNKNKIMAASLRSNFEELAFSLPVTQPHILAENVNLHGLTGKRIESAKTLCLLCLIANWVTFGG